MAEIAEYISVQDSPESAEQVIEKILAAAGSLSLNPARGRPVPELKAVGIGHYREILVHSYRIMFRVRGNDVGIMGVLDGRRDLEELLLNRILGSP